MSQQQWLRAVPEPRPVESAADVVRALASATVTATPPQIDSMTFRRVAGRFATGVTVVSTVQDGVRLGMTVNSFASVSLDPLLVLFCCERYAAIHDPLLANGHWAVSVLRADQQATSRRFARRYPPGLDAWSGVSAVAGRETGNPMLADALATLECRTTITYDGGDHTIVVGSVLAAETGRPGEPLLYFDSHYRTTAPRTHADPARG